MKQAIGLLELNNITQGILAADIMLKSGNVELVMSQSLCPGKYVVMVAGDVGAIQSAVNSGKQVGMEHVVDDFILPNVHPSVFPALSGCTDIARLNALGIIESYSVASAIIAADSAVKAGSVELIEVRLARGMGGKALVVLTGDVGAVKTAVAAGSAMIAKSGFLVDKLVLAAPHKHLYNAIV